MALPYLPQRQQGPAQRHTEPLPPQRFRRHLTSKPASAGPPIEDPQLPPALPASAPAAGQPRREHDAPLTIAASAAQDVTIPEEMRHKRFKHLPRGTKPVSFVGEGAANAVFEIKVPQHGLSDQNFKGLLLRVAKVPAPGQPTAYNYLFQQTFYQTAVQPLLGAHAIHQELVVLRGSGIVDELNRMLRDLDHVRKAKFRGSCVGHTDWGLLIEDMRPPAATATSPSPPRSLLVEFKPKWLSQSRSAPANAVRCRQCALELQRLLERSIIAGAGAGTFKCAADRKPCPLALVDDEAPPKVSSPFRIAPQLQELPDRAHLQASLERILRDPFLDNLRAHQERLDATGPLSARADDERFGIAMTIRDCTCFALIPRGDSEGDDGEIKIRLGDLDWKDPKTKLQHWRGTEQALIDGGFYTADWILCDGAYYHPPTLCLLEWKPRVASARPDVIELQDHNDAGDSTEEASVPHIYRHKADVAMLKQKLQPYSGAGSDPFNPHRPQPI